MRSARSFSAIGLTSGVPPCCTTVKKSAMIATRMMRYTKLFLSHLVSMRGGTLPGVRIIRAGLLNPRYSADYAVALVRGVATRMFLTQCTIQCRTAGDTSGSANQIARSPARHRLARPGRRTDCPAELAGHAEGAVAAVR